MAIRWAQDPGPEPHTSRLDDAADRGFDPGERPHPTAEWIEGEFQLSLHDDAFDWFTAGVRALRIIGPLTRCAHPHCHTSVTEDDVSFCPHNLPFCEACTWEDGCDDCANSNPTDTREAS